MGVNVVVFSMVLVITISLVKCPSVVGVGTTKWRKEEEEKRDEIGRVGWRDESGCCRKYQTRRQ